MSEPAADATWLKALHESEAVRICDTEQEFHKSWQRWAKDIDNPLEMAIVGGGMVLNFGLIFSAGYQAALRRIFPDVDFAAWGAFAVSEDKSGVLPGVTAQETAAGFVLNGSKTWIAASACVEEVVLSARLGEKVRSFRVGRDTPGMTIATRSPGRVLPALSQGTATLDDVLVDVALRQDRVGQFASAEVVYIYTAFLASTWRRWPPRRDAVLPLLSLAQRVHENHELARESMVELDRGVQALLRSLRQGEGGIDDLWRRDYKLIEMYANPVS